jgi:hypothetical protein
MLNDVLSARLNEPGVEGLRFRLHQPEGVAQSQASSLGRTKST